MPHSYHVFGELYCLLLTESGEANNASSMIAIFNCTAPTSANLGRLKENQTMLCQVHLDHTTSLACEGTQDDSYGMLRLPLLSRTQTKIHTATAMEKEEDAKLHPGTTWSVGWGHGPCPAREKSYNHVGATI